MAALRAGWPEFGDAERLVPADIARLSSQATRID